MEKIAIIIPYLKLGGTERQAYYIAEHLKSKYQVTIIIFENNGGFKDAYKDLNIHCLDIDFNTNNYIKIIYKLAGYLKEQKFNLAISRAWSANVIVGAASLWKNTPYSLFLSGPTNLKGNSIKKIIQKFFLEKAHLVLSVSNKAKINSIENYNVKNKNIKVVQNGVDIEYVKKLSNQEISDNEFFNINKDEFIISFLGRLVHRKGLDLLIEALENIKRTREDIKKIKLVIIGVGEKENEYKDRINKLNLNDYVTFLGEQKNPFKYLVNSDIFAFPSRNEGFPNALLEAMALGVPSIAANCETGPSEVIDNEINGILIEVNDSNSLAKKIIELYDNPLFRKEIGEKAKETIQEKYSLQVRLKEIEKEIKKVI